MQTSTDKKMRNSATRNSIYEYLCGTKAHPSAEMIYLDLRENNPNLSLGTVYRNLNQLEAMGKVIRVANYDNTALKKLCGGGVGPLGGAYFCRAFVRKRDTLHSLTLSRYDSIGLRYVTL